MFELFRACSLVSLLYFEPAHPHLMHIIEYCCPAGLSEEL